MKESYGEGLATHTAPESCGVACKGGVEAFDRGTCGPGIQPRKRIPSGCRRCKEKRKAPSGASKTREAPGPRAVRDPVHVRKHLAREPGDPVFAHGRWRRGPRREV